MVKHHLARRPIIGPPAPLCSAPPSLPVIVPDWGVAACHGWNTERVEKWSEIGGLTCSHLRNKRKLTHVAGRGVQPRGRPGISLLKGGWDALSLGGELVSEGGGCSPVKEEQKACTPYPWRVGRDGDSGGVGDGERQTPHLQKSRMGRAGLELVLKFALGTLAPCIPGAYNPRFGSWSSFSRLNGSSCEKRPGLLIIFQPLWILALIISLICNFGGSPGVWTPVAFFPLPCFTQRVLSTTSWSSVSAFIPVFVLLLGGSFVLVSH